MRQLLKPIGAPCAQAILAILWLSVIALGQTVTDMTLETAQTVTAQKTFNLGIIYGPITFANLAVTPPQTNGTEVYVSDGSPTAPCTGSGSGAFAFRANGAWNCYAAGTTEQVTGLGVGTGLSFGSCGATPAIQFPSSTTATTYGGAPWAFNQATFSWPPGVTDNIFSWGYNVGQAFCTLVAGKPQIGWQTEVDYFDGTYHLMETFLNYSTDGTQTTAHRPLSIVTRLTDHTYSNTSVTIGSNSASIFSIAAASTPLLNVLATGDVLFGADGSGSIGQDTNYRPTNVNVRTLVKVPRLELNGDRFVVKAANTDSVIDIFASSHKARFSPDQADGVISFQDNTGSDVLTMTMPTGVFNLQNMNGSGNAVTQLSLSAATNQASNNMTQWKNSGGTVTTSVASDATFSTIKLNTNTNCANNGTAASPSVVTCTAAAAGSFSCATNAVSTCTVNTTAVTANSQVFVTQRLDTTTGTRLGVTCNTAANATIPYVNAVVAATSFSIPLTQPVTNPQCYSYFIVN